MTAAPVPPRPLLLVMPSLGLGGMERQLVTLAESYVAAGGRVTFVAGDGALAEHAATLGRVRLLHWETQSCAETAASVAELLTSGGASIMQIDPRTLHLLPLLAQSTAVHLCMHNRPGTFQTWLSERMIEFLRRFVSTLHASGALAITAASRPHAEAHAREFDLPTDSVVPWYPAVCAPPTAYGASSGPVRTVVVIARFSTEKLFAFDAASRLVAAGRQRGENVMLEVYGDGPREDAVAAMLADRLGSAGFVLHGPTADPLGAAARGDVVVNGGRAAIEGLMVRRRVVSVHTGRPDNPLGDVVTPANFPALLERNFAETDVDRSADELWSLVRAISADEVTFLEAAARARLSPAALLSTHQDVLARCRPAGGHAALEDALITHALQAEDEFRELKPLADWLWQERQARRPPGGS